MTNVQLEGFRKIADNIHGNVPQNWKWIGPHLSQRMFGISRERAIDYAKKYGGEASPDAVAMTAAHCAARLK